MRRLVLACLVLGLLAARSWGEEKDEIARAGVDEHLALAAKLEKAGFRREAFLELLLAIELDPACRAARERLGYTKEGGEWKGTPLVPEPSPKALEGALAKERAGEHAKIARRLASLAQSAKRAGQEERARHLAGLALDENPDEKTAREALGHERKGAAWTSPREARIEAAFAKARESASPGKEAAGDPEIVLFMGELARRETAHAVLLATRSARADLAEQAKVCETAWAACEFFLRGDSSGFSLEGEPTLEKKDELAPLRSPRLLFLSRHEHFVFVENAVPDERKRELYKRLTGAAAVVSSTDGQKLTVYDTLIDKEGHAEWTATTVASFLARARLASGARLPDFLFEGVRRFTSGHVSGRAGRSFYGEGSGTLKDRFLGATFPELRARVREAVASSLEGDLRVLLAKNANDLEQDDAPRALAFIDYCFAKERAKLASFLGSLEKDGLAVMQFEVAFGRPIESVERDFREFVRQEY